MDPDPRQAAKCDLESASPVDPLLNGILPTPAFELPHDLAQKLLAAGEQVSLRQQHQVLMPVEFPDTFVVAGLGRVEIGNAPKIHGLRFHAAGIIPPPANIWIGLQRCAQQRDAMRQYLFRNVEAIACEGSCHKRACNLLWRRQARTGSLSLCDGESRQARREGQEPNGRRPPTEPESDFARASHLPSLPYQLAQVPVRPADTCLDEFPGIFRP